MYIERKAGNLTGPARIGRVTYSKTGATIYYRGKEFRSLKDAGFKANYYDVDPEGFRRESNRMYHQWFRLLGMSRRSFPPREGRFAS